MKGLEIVIARMQSNPEEFYDGTTKWAWIGHREMQKALTGEEQEKLNNALTEVRRHEFTHRAMQTLLPPEEKGYTVKAGPYSFTPTNTTRASIVADSNAGTLTLNNGSGKEVTLTPEMVEYLAERVGGKV